MAVVRGLYDHLGFALTPDTEARMATYLRDHEEGKAGGQYDLAAFGIDPVAVRARFARYSARFAVAPVAS